MESPLFSVSSVRAIVDENRIVGGAEFEGLPAVGAITIKRANKFRPHCTGTLIGVTTILTAAHCVHGYDSYEMELVLSPDAWAPHEGSRFRIAARKVHEDYVPDANGINDIALLFVDATVVPPADVPRIPFADPPLAEQLFAQKSTLAFIGYGYAKRDGYKVDLGRKRRVDMPVKSHDATTFRYQVPGKNTCNGDSGGPALWSASPSSSIETLPVVVGVTSWGDGPCEDFGVNTRVDAHFPWIRRYFDMNVKSSSSSP